MILGSTITPEEGVPFAAEIFVSNLEKTLQYYCEVLGFEIHRLDKKGRFAALKFNNSIFMVQEEDNLEKLRRVGVSLRFIIDARRNLQRISPAVTKPRQENPKGFVTDIDGYYKKVKSRGAIIYEPLEMMDYGLRRFKVKDPEGYIIKFCISP